MPELPTGMVTLLFTDIEGSTELLRRLGDGYAQVQADHRRLLRQAFAAHAGHEVDTQGDAFFVVFAQPQDALAGTVAAQRALTAHPWPPGAPVRVRMGLHTGRPVLGDEGYLGLDVHQAARVEAAAHGGQVLLSQTTARLVQDDLPPGVGLRPLGSHRLKDFAQPQPLFQLLIEGLPASFPPIRTLLGRGDDGEDTQAEPPRAPLVGRTEELAALRTQLAQAIAGRGSLVLLAGEPGIGKTRLAEELAAEARRQGVSVLWGRCWEGEGAPPFWPWQQVLRAIALDRSPLTLRAELGSGAADIARIVAEVAERLPDLPERPPLDPEAARFRLFDAVSQALANVTQARPLLLVLDDLHWADKPSLVLLQFLVQQFGTARLLVVGTYRDTDLDRRHPLAEVLPALRRERGFERLLLRGLSLAEVTALLEARAEQRLDAGGRALAAALHRETEGNPFFIGEVLRHLVDTGGFAQREGRWQVTAPGIEALGIPEGVREVIGRRLSRLSEETNQLLTRAAIIGREFEVAELEPVSGMGAEALDAALEEAEAARVLEPSGHGERYRFAHALIGQTLREELPARRRVRLHRQVGEALEGLYGARAAQHAGRLAAHFVEAGEGERAVRYSVLAGEQAEAATAWEEAARYYEQVLTLLAESETDAAAFGQNEAALLTRLGTCLRNGGEYRAGWRNLLRAIYQYRARGDGTGQARATLEVLTIFAPPERRGQLARAALAALDPEQEPRLAGCLLAALLNPGTTGRHEPEELARWRKQVDELLVRHPSPEVAARVDLAEFSRAWWSAGTEYTLDLGRRTHAALDAQGLTTLAAQMLMTWVVKVQDVRGLAASEAALEEALAYARRHHIRFVENSVQVAIAGRLLAHAEYDAFDAAVAAYTGGPSWQMQGLEALRWAQAGELPRALLRLPEPDLAAGMPDWIIFTQAVRAQVLWLAGETEAAALAWAAVLEAVPTHPLAVTIDGITTEPFSLLNGAGEALVHLANAAVLAAVDRWLDEKEGEGPAPIFYVAYCESALRQAGLIRLWNGHLDAAETTLRAGLAWCERERCPVEAGRCLLGLAEVAERRGQCEQALADLDRAAALFGQHGAKLYLEQAQTRRTRLRT